MGLTYDPVEPEADPRFKPIDVRVRLRSEAERARLAAERVTFTCGICGQTCAEQSSFQHIRSQPMPGNLCISCVDRHGMAWGLNANWRSGNRRDFAHMRALAAVTHALLAEVRP